MSNETKSIVNSISGVIGGIFQGQPLVIADRQILVKSRDNKVRKAAKKQGFIVTRSRVKNTTCDNYGNYMIINESNNSIEYGEKFNLTLEEVENFIYAKQYDSK